MSDFKAKMHKIRFPLGLRHKPRWGSLQRSPSPLAVFKVGTSKGRAGEEGGDGKGKGRGRKEEEQMRGEEGRGGEGPGPQIFRPRTAPGYSAGTSYGPVSVSVCHESEFCRKG